MKERFFKILRCELWNIVQNVVFQEKSSIFTVDCKHKFADKMEVKISRSAHQMLSSWNMEKRIFVDFIEQVHQNIF